MMEESQLIPKSKQKSFQGLEADIGACSQRHFVSIAFTQKIDKRCI